VVNSQGEEVPNSHALLLETSEEKIVLFKIKFLGVRHSWEMFSDSYKELGLTVDGYKLEKVYLQWQSEGVTFSNSKPKDAEKQSTS
jgi:hypothetical protein